MTDSIKALRSGDRVIALDGLRGLAILLVIFHHFFEPEEGNSSIVNAIGGIAHFGWCGVDLFFVLSGFLITGILLDSKGKEKFFSRFYLRRTVRIFPLYYASLLLLFVVRPLLKTGSLQGAGDSSQLWFWLYLQNFEIAAKADYGIFGHAWSLCVEEQFYLVWPLTVFLCSRERLRQISWWIIGFAFICRCVLIAAGPNYVPAYVLLFTRADTLAAGALIAIAGRSPTGLSNVLSNSRRILMLAAASILAVIIFQGDTSRGPFMMVLGLSFLAAFFSMLLVTTLKPTAGGVTRMLSTRFLRFFGKYSYCLYIVHVFVYQDVVRALTRLHIAALPPGTLPFALTAFALALGASVLLAMLSWKFLEAPMLRLKKSV